MIKRLKIKYIVLALSSLLVLLAFIVTGMNLLNYNAVIEDADETLELLSQNQGAFPTKDEQNDDWLPPDMSPEIPFESRFFSVLVNSSEDIVSAETSQIYVVDGEAAVEYANEALEKNADKGFVENYRYVVTVESNGTRVTFLDCGRKLDLYHDFAIFSIWMSLAGYAVIAVFVCFFVSRISRPVAESYEKQKRFITDAGHEIKTPLTIISANVDVLKMDLGENESLDDIAFQAKRLAGLTNDLVSLARMEESDQTMQMIEFPVSEIVSETAAPFGTLAKTQKKELVCEVQPMLTLCGNDKAISKLVSILLDNAMKYSPEGSKIRLDLEQQGRKLVLTVANPASSPLTEEDLHHVFDRFYRTDPSRNSETGGHGIGLSMAQAIVSAHKGKISASSDDTNAFIVKAVFPLPSA